MLDSVKQYIKELPDIDFGTYYQNYICNIQDQNILLEIRSIKSSDILPMFALLDELKR